MKRILTAVLAAATFATPLALPAQADAQNYRYRGNDHDGRDRDGAGRDRDWRRDNYRRDGRHDYRDGRRDQRRWDNRSHNGYTYNGRWYYGPPPAAYGARAEYGWRSWRRGDRL